MCYDLKLVSCSLRRWKQYMDNFSLPEWAQLPKIGLYMDQLLTVLSKYLEFLPKDEGEDRIVTASAINNYVRIKAMPAPEKKKYGRVHIAYLIMICTLKQSISITQIQKILPHDLSEEVVEKIYNGYINKHYAAKKVFIEQVAAHAGNILSPNDNSEYAVEDLVYSAAIISGFSKLLAEKLLDIKNCEFTEEQISEEVNENSLQ